MGMRSKFNNQLQVVLSMSFSIVKEITITLHSTGLWLLILQSETQYEDPSIEQVIKKKEQESIF